jgi:hypothetical protein
MNAPGMVSSGGFKAAMGQSSAQAGSQVDENQGSSGCPSTKFLHFFDLSESFYPKTK